MKSENKQIVLKRILSKLTHEEKTCLFGLIGKDPLVGIYPWTLSLYLVIMTVLLLWPFDFMFPVKNGVRWINDGCGIEFVKRGKAVSSSPTTAFCREMIQGNGLTVEVWIATAKNDQKGPARIISYSIDTGRRDFSLGQEGSDLVMRLRTTETDPNGVEPHLVARDVFTDLQPMHVVVTYDFQTQKIYIDGQRRAQADVPGGRFSNWEDSFPVILGNEASGGRPWLGKMFYAAIYNRPLEEEEIDRHFRSGWVGKERSSASNSTSQQPNPIVRYVFSEGKGSRIHDNGRGEWPPLDLHIPDKINFPKEPYLGGPSNYTGFQKGSPLYKMRGYLDIILNIFAFIPLGFFAHGLTRQYFHPAIKISMFILIAGCLFSFGIESLQYFSSVRDSSSVDLVNNSIGTMLGILLYKQYTARLRAGIK